jgi:hypothetical protein
MTKQQTLQLWQSCLSALRFYSVLGMHEIHIVGRRDKSERDRDRGLERDKERQRERERQREGGRERERDKVIWRKRGENESEGN